MDFVVRAVAAGHTGAAEGPSRGHPRAARQLSLLEKKQSPLLSQGAVPCIMTWIPFASEVAELMVFEVSNSSENCEQFPEKSMKESTGPQFAHNVSVSRSKIPPRSEFSPICSEIPQKVLRKRDSIFRASCLCRCHFSGSQKARFDLLLLSKFGAFLQNFCRTKSLRF
jgi:hypothetical protein